MGGALVWAGSIAGALIAIGTLARYLLRRLVRAAVWTAAAIRLPETVDRLSDTVNDLTTSVDRLTAAVDQLHPNVLERL
jgi:outer membrane murein-binding lipoprotein Lpp